MNLNELHRKLISVARDQRPSEQVPYAFEKRIMARLVTAPVLDVWEAWSAALWRAAAPCVGLMILLGAWAYFGAGSNSASTDLSQDYENAVLAEAVLEQPGTVW